MTQFAECCQRVSCASGRLRDRGEGSGGKAGFTTCYNKNGDRASCARSDSRVVGRGRHVEGVLSEGRRGEGKLLGDLEAVWVRVRVKVKEREGGKRQLGAFELHSI